MPTLLLFLSSGSDRANVVKKVFNLWWENEDGEIEYGDPHVNFYPVKGFRPLVDPSIEAILAIFDDNKHKSTSTYEVRSHRFIESDEEEKLVLDFCQYVRFPTASDSESVMKSTLNEIFIEKFKQNYSARIIQKGLKKAYQHKWPIETEIVEGKSEVVQWAVKYMKDHAMMFRSCKAVPAPSPRHDIVIVAKRKMKDGTDSLIGYLTGSFESQTSFGIIGLCSVRNAGRFLTMQCKLFWKENHPNVKRIVVEPFRGVETFYQKCDFKNTRSGSMVLKLQ